MVKFIFRRNNPLPHTYIVYISCQVAIEISVWMLYLYSKQSLVCTHVCVPILQSCHTTV